MKILLGTHNKGKIKEIVEMLGDLPIEIVTLPDSDREEPEENGKTYFENALKEIWHSRTFRRFGVGNRRPKRETGNLISTLFGRRHPVRHKNRKDIENDEKRKKPQRPFQNGCGDIFSGNGKNFAHGRHRGG